jgi:hypothetical protein
MLFSYSKWLLERKLYITNIIAFPEFFSDGRSNMLFVMEPS